MYHLTGHPATRLDGKEARGYSGESKEYFSGVISDLKGRPKTISCQQFAYFHASVREAYPK